LKENPRLKSLDIRNNSLEQKNAQYEIELARLLPSNIKIVNNKEREAILKNFSSYTTKKNNNASSFNSDG